ncbi:MAG TPA: NTP transferase domain-containing protein [Thermoplasmata archaeon]|nr:NTP transferase domain-containing protein [Thermoplasmata archaeon]
MAPPRGATARAGGVGNGTVAIVLAAGVSSRMGRPKGAVPFEGTPLLELVLQKLRSAGVGSAVVVLGHGAEQVRRSVRFLNEKVVVASDYRAGMSRSLAAGLGAVPTGARRVMVVLADQPFIEPSTYARLARRAAEPDGRIFIPTFRGIRGNPVLFDYSLASEATLIEGDVGCRAMFPHHLAEIREVPLDDPGILVDIDTEADLAAFDEAARRHEPLRTTLLRAAGPRLALHASPSERPAPRRLWRPPDVGAAAEALRRQGLPFALATVVRAVRPTSGRPGYSAVIRPDGSHVGWVGGACTEDLLVAEALVALREGTPRLLRVTPEPTGGSPPEGVVERPMVCASGGTVEIYIEPKVPKPTLLIVGDSPVATSLAALGPLLDLRVVLAAPGADAADLPQVDALLPDLEEVTKHVGPATYAVVASMGKYDETALELLADRPLAFLGLVASRKRAASVFANLREAGMRPELIARVRNPVGVEISAETPEEIALSVVAEVVRERRTARPTAPEVAPPPAEAPAVDPVCHMEVDRSSPLHASHAGTTYYFCAESCRRKFVRSPERYLTASA